MPLKVNLAHHPLDALCVVIDLGHVLLQELHQHQRLVLMAHAHAFGDGLPQALVGGGGGWGHGGILAGIPSAGRLAGAGSVTGGGTCRGEALLSCPPSLPSPCPPWRVPALGFQRFLMAMTPMSDLLQLPRNERLALAIALWDSLDQEAREGALPLDSALCADRSALDGPSRQPCRSSALG